MTTPNLLDTKLLIQREGHEEDKGGEENLTPLGEGKGGVEICPASTIWKKRIRFVVKEEVCPRGTVCKKWVRVVHVVNGWNAQEMPWAPHSRGRTGLRQTRRRNRQLRETRRRRRALRRKRLRRHKRRTGHHHPRAWLQGGAGSGEADEQVCFMFIGVVAPPCHVLSAACAW